MKEFEEHPELDQYDETMLDETAYPAMSAEQRRKADQEINKRKRKAMR
jgi:hypothetical protein